MPSATFFNLPEHKREKLLDAARKEFSRIPYDQVSVNQIILAAGIPRGSFYMYFTDKEELFHYLLSSYTGEMKALIQSMLLQYGGDLFAALLAAFNYLADGLEQGNLDASCDSLMQIMRCNRQMRPDLMLAHGPPADLSDWVRQYVNWNALDLREEEDFQTILSVVVGITGAAMGTITNGGEETAAARARLTRTFDILRRGMEKKAP